MSGHGRKSPPDPEKGARRVGSEEETGGSAGVCKGCRVGVDQHPRGVPCSTFGVELPPPSARELARALRAYDPTHPLLDTVPEEWLE